MDLGRLLVSEDLWYSINEFHAQTSKREYWEMGILRYSVILLLLGFDV